MQSSVLFVTWSKISLFKGSVDDIDKLLFCRSVVLVVLDGRQWRLW